MAHQEFTAVSARCATLTVGEELLRAVAERDSADPGERAHWVRETARAFTLLARAYEEARRAVAYLRSAERDVDRVLPSLFVKTGAYPR